MIVGVTALVTHIWVHLLWHTPFYVLCYGFPVCLTCLWVCMQYLLLSVESECMCSRLMVWFWLSVFASLLRSLLLHLCLCVSVLLSLLLFVLNPTTPNDKCISCCLEMAQKIKWELDGFLSAGLCYKSQTLSTNWKALPSQIDWYWLSCFCCLVSFN